MPRFFSVVSLVLLATIGAPTAASAAYNYYLKVPLQLTHIPSKTDNGTTWELWVRCSLQDAKDGKGPTLGPVSEAKVPLDSSGDYSGALNFKLSSAKAAVSYTCHLQGYTTAHSMNVDWPGLITGTTQVTGNF